MTCPGIVTNVTNFGAFVDIGVHQDGLVHLSQLADRFVKDPRDVVNPGDRVTVRVLEVNLEKNQIALSMKSEARPREARAEQRPEQRREQRNEQRPKPNFAKDRKPEPKREAKPAKPAFNNPFADLANWKKPQ
jgi:uncharacterized protein